MSDFDQEIEQEIQEKGLTAPRVTPKQINALVEDVIYYVEHIPDTTTIIASAFLVMGEDDTFMLCTEYSACASPENFDFEIGRKIALEKAETKAKEMLWLLEGYALKRSLTSIKTANPSQDNH